MHLWSRICGYSTVFLVLEVSKSWAVFLSRLSVDLEFLPFPFGTFTASFLSGKYRFFVNSASTSLCVIGDNQAHQIGQADDVRWKVPILARRMEFEVRWKVVTLAHSTVDQTLKSNLLKPISWVLKWPKCVWKLKAQSCQKRPEKAQDKCATSPRAS